MWDPVPWIVSGGAVHSSNVARNVAYAAFGGSEGIVDPKGLEVRQLTTAGSQVRIFPGTAAIQHRGTGIQDEMYVAQNVAVHTLDIAPNSGSTTRSDLIVARVEDPNEPGASWPAPVSVENGPYVFTRVISNVPASTKTAADLGLGHSMIALARNVLDNGAGTIIGSRETLWATSPNAADERMIMATAGDEVFIPTHMRGKTVTVRMANARYNGSASKIISVGSGCVTVIDLEFYQNPESNE